MYFQMFCFCLAPFKHEIISKILRRLNYTFSYVNKLLIVQRLQYSHLPLDPSQLHVQAVCYSLLWMSPPIEPRCQHSLTYGILLVVNWINMFTSTIMKTTVIQCCKYYLIQFSNQFQIKWYFLSYRFSLNSQWEVLLPDALHSITTQHERFFGFQRRSSCGTSMPSWLHFSGPILLQRFVWTSTMIFLWTR